ncbi:stringent starvation B family protein [Neorickettsia helminthoeca str. Oregon]|uniref:Stringent starvation B family protein n=1 Tax=Neorickettsia helminthoeca str. Oregon TaxID=1286528 RepID=X5H3V6_9RICK|nr:ClpXP protease specificity-enhancing factor SspB [Neorickettsia helminthoeca]AHX11378.1 stringent starvation B family protein [Neorickettsia helminthoeca str. Oregon]
MKEEKYKTLVDAAMLGVVRSVVSEASTGTPINFFITFRTDASGVVLSDALRAKYPSEMSIVLQNQFRDLKVFHDRFTVILSFSRVEERISVPFSSILYFLDRECNFALEFQNLYNKCDSDESDTYDGGSGLRSETNAQKNQEGKIIDITDMLTRK